MSPVNQLSPHAVLHRDELVHQLKAERAVRGEERRRTKAATAIQMHYRWGPPPPAARPYLRCNILAQSSASCLRLQGPQVQGGGAPSAAGAVAV